MRQGDHQPGQPMPLTAEEWRHVVHALTLTPQQARIVELLLRGCRDKQIAEAMGLRVPTVRTHLRSVFRGVGVADRMELVLRVFHESRNHAVRGRDHQK